MRYIIPGEILRVNLKIKIGIVFFAICMFLLVGCDSDPESSGPNRFPDAPYQPVPADNSINQNINAGLTWECFDSDGDQLKYDVYFGIDSLPLLADTNITVNTYDPGPLLYLTDYFWKIIARDPMGHESEGPVWRFRTSVESGIYLVGNYDTPSSANDISVIGNYAYIADWQSGLQVIDISDPTNPTHAGGLDLDTDVFNVLVSDGVAFLTDDEYRIYLVDVTIPGSPTLASTYQPQESIYDFYAADGYAYLAHGYSGIHILDVTDPQNPALAGVYNPGGVVQRLFISGNYLYLGMGSLYFNILNLDDPANPSLVSSTYIDTYISKMFISDNYAYFMIGSRRLLIYDISNLSNPQPVSDTELFDHTINIFDIYVSGGYLFAAAAYDGVIAIDVSNPLEPLIFGTFAALSYISGVHATPEYIFAADHQSGLDILEIVP